MLRKKVGLPRLGALAVLLPPLSLKKPRPNEDLAFFVPKASSSTARELLVDFGGKVVILLNSSNA